MNNFLGEITGNSSKNRSKLSDLGLMESVPEYLACAEVTEETAWDLQGLVFYEDELHWCEVTDWGVDHGVIILFYTPGFFGPSSR